MLIESKNLKESLIELKQQTINTLDRAKQNKVKNQMLAIITAIESILIWIHQSEKEGELNMEALKIGLGKTVKLSDIKTEPRSRMDQAIIEEASYLNELGDARAIDPSAVDVTYFINRVYALAKDGRIHPDAKPVKNGNELYIALKKGVKRSKVKV